MHKQVCRTNNSLCLSLDTSSRNTPNNAVLRAEKQGSGKRFYSGDSEIERISVGCSDFRHANFLVVSRSVAFLSFMKLKVQRQFSYLHE